MNRNYLLYIIFFVLLAIAVYFLIRGNNGAISKVERNISIKDTARVSMIVIEEGLNKIILSKENTSWRINGNYPANQDRIKGLLLALSRLRISAPAPAAFAFNIKNKLLGEGKKISFVEGNKPIKGFYVYYDTILSQATYILVEQSGNPFRIELPGFRLQNISLIFQTSVNYWRDLSLAKFQPEEIKSVGVYNYDDPETSFYILFDGRGEYRLMHYTDSSAAEDCNKAEIAVYLANFQDIQFEYFASGLANTIQYKIGTSPMNRIDITDKSGFRTDILTYPKYLSGDDGIWKEDYNRLYAILNTTDTVVLKYIEIDPILKGINYFLLK